MKQTALMMLIEDVKANMNGCLVDLNEDGLTELERRHYNSAIIVAKDVIEKATNLLKLEREQIEEAFNLGTLDGDGGNSINYKNGEDYYTKTFKP